MLERWAGLTRFVDDPRVPLDNNGAYAAHGISAGMPRPELCRVRPLLRRSLAVETLSAERDAA
jgi:hypothetical protein